MIIIMREKEHPEKDYANFRAMRNSFGSIAKRFANQPQNRPMDWPILINTTNYFMCAQ